MAAASPSDEDNDPPDKDDAKDGDEGADPGEEVIEDISEVVPLKLISRGDTLPISYRSDNGTRESEFYVGDDERENVNPYYDVVRRLSPTELIGRFMRTSSPRVRLQGHSCS